MKYGAKMITESALEAVPNETPQRDYEIHFTIPEFPCLAPDSGFPDFATIRIRYIPDRMFFLIIPRPLRSTLFPYRTLFRSAAETRTLYGLVAISGPRLMEEVGVFNARGNIK